MTMPFDHIAASYAELWTGTPRGRSQREQVWRVIGGLFRAGDRILDLGCGTGDDALHLMSRGVEVVGVDASARMVEIARSRGVDARVQDVSQGLLFLSGGSAAGTNACAASFSGAISNFGVMNCIRNLDSVTDALARVLAPGSFAAFCVMGRYRWCEPRRWRGRALWRGMNVFYRSWREMERTFAPEFRLARRISIGGGDHTLLVFERQP
jgi:SAM-dependent methyltransferase